MVEHDSMRETVPDSQAEMPDAQALIEEARVHRRQRRMHILIASIMAVLVLGGTLAAVRLVGSGNPTGPSPLRSGVSDASHPGVITGLVSPCAGVELPSAFAQIPVRVTLSQRAHRVASQVIQGMGTYRFNEPQGEYVVSTDQSSITPTHVTVHSGEVARVNLLAECK